MGTHFSVTRRGGGTHELRHAPSYGSSHDLLAILLPRLGRYRTDEPSDDRRAPPADRVYQDVLIALESGFRTEHGVAQYAEALSLAPARLSRAHNRAAGKTAKQLIAERIVLEAKRLLTYTSLSMKEIVQSLGFSDRFRFSKAFKNPDRAAVPGLLGSVAERDISPSPFAIPAARRRRCRDQDATTASRSPGLDPRRWPIVDGARPPGRAEEEQGQHDVRSAIRIHQRRR